MKRKLLCVASVVLFACAQQAMAEVIPTVIADYMADFQTVTPATGWAYQWNPTGYDIGDSANYANLVWSTVSSSFPGYEGSTTAYPCTNPADANYARLFNATASTFSHPGKASDLSSDGRDHWVIAGYTVQDGEAGAGTIENSAVYRHSGSTGGSIDLRVYVNDDLIDEINVNSNSANAFNWSLGNLDVGDKVYVAVGAHGSDATDTFHYAYQISTTPIVPEPSAIALAVIGLFGMIAYAWRKRR